MMNVTNVTLSSLGKGLGERKMCIFKKIDQVLCNVELKLIFPEGFARVLTHI